MAERHGWLTTERLCLHRFAPSDLDWLCGLYDDPTVTRYLGGRLHRQQVEEMLDTRILRYYDEHPGLGIWMTTERAGGRPIGFHLLNHIRGESIVQVGFALEAEAWGKGYGTEMARAVVRYAFADLQLPRVSGMASLLNLASQRVLAKIGLERNGERAFPHPAYAAEGPMAWFERERDAWLVQPGP